MTALAKSNEPTMEEILASIRKIIADDHAATVKPAAVTAPPAANPAPVAAPAPAQQPAAPLAPAPDNDILDLATEATPVEEEEPQSQDDIDLLFADPEPAPAAKTPEPAPSQPMPPPPAPPPPAPAPAPFVAQVAAAVEPAASQLMSQATSASVAGAFASLSTTLLSQNARTLDDLVQEMLRPMLKTWLDDNLPGIVERLVRAEIERVSRGVR
jgi:hypothetical protein